MWTSETVMETLLCWWIGGGGHRGQGDSGRERQQQHCRWRQKQGMLWRPETHTFHFSIGECAVTLEDVAIIPGLLINGLPVTGPTLSSYEALEGHSSRLQGDRWSTDPSAYIGLDPSTISFADFRQSSRLSDCKQFVWEAYAFDCIEVGVIPADIRQHLVIWSATMSLISFECVEWMRRIG
ncbi:hypothetical protein Ahy_B06g081686 [Arachis hypogaea]|uniref:Aminotransferase-like plant mobile domain-containing protein n=1 Tax=Arachis hypogaea TaxID=3818 RepID=A0A444YLM3_ARAHY|nr:hypothetical protein Ahy_B06g081686 [Arachis hypogaea]